MTAGAPAGPEAAPADRRRPARRAPTDLPFRFADDDLARRLAAERGEPDWLAAERLAGAEAFARLPIEGNRLYTTYVDLRAADLLTAEPYVATAAGPSGVPAGTPAGTAGLVEIRDDDVASLALSPAAASAGVRVDTFGGLLAHDPDRLRALLGRDGTLPVDDRLAQLARGFWSQGLVIDVPAGVRLDEPIVLRWAVGRPDRALISRTIVTLGEGAEATLLEELVEPDESGSADDPQGLFSGTLELDLGRGARLAVASLQELGPRQVAFQHRSARLADDARLRWALGQLGGVLVKSRIDNRLEGDRSAVEQVEIVFGSEAQFFDLTSYTRHVGRDTTGNLLSKGVMLGGARAFFKGLITIEKSARGTDSFLGEFGMHLTKKARSVAIPSLEIDQPDCRRAAHSSSVGPIDDAQLFYLESRGLTPEEARKFIVLGFLEPVVARVPLASAQDDLRERLEEKWAAASVTGVAGTTAAA